MTTSNLINQLKERGFIYQITNEQSLVNRLKQATPIVLYCGFDPTADSLHLGHIVPLMCLKRFQKAGHKPITLIGGGTGLIGDPSFKSNERKINNIDIVIEWVNKINKQFSLFIDFSCEKNSAIIVNNYKWLSRMTILDFLCIVGKHFAINQLINKDAVKNRLKEKDIGLSFTEFAYNLLQSYDFAYLNAQYGVELQIGGSDQWGNITSGIDLTRRLHQKKVFGLTIPLITKSDGMKFGKTEANTIWLDATKTSPYKFYQFWVNTADIDVYRFLKLFTFIDITTINSLEKDDNNHYAQLLLAEHVTQMVHGNQGFAAAKRITQNLFYGNINDMKEEDFKQLAQDGVPAIEIIDNIDLQQALVKANLVPSRTQAKSLINAGAITVNSQIQTNYKYQFSNFDKIFGRYTLLRRGKKSYCLVYWK
ncbi:MAG: tyrosine--tRNA ligase [Candidatus Dasytiphilus stammeri]